MSSYTAPMIFQPGSTTGIEILILNALVQAKSTMTMLETRTISRNNGEKAKEAEEVAVQMEPGRANRPVAHGVERRKGRHARPVTVFHFS